LLQVLESNLRSNLEATLEAQARDRAQLIDGGAPAASLVETRAEESIVAIVDADAIVVAQGGTYLLVDPLDGAVAGSTRTATVRLQEVSEQGAGREEGDEETGGDEEVETSKIVYSVAGAGDGTLVVVGAELEVVDRTVAEVRNLLLVGLPFLLLAVGGITWRATGRTLRPVEDIRMTAAEIGDGPIEERIPVPDTRDEVARLAATMNQMLDRIAAGQRAQRQFTSDASHELKSPVANLRALAETAVVEDPDWPATRRRLIDESERLAAIVDDLLFMAVTDEQSVTGDRTLVHLDDLLFDEAGVLAATTALRVDIDSVGPCDVVGVPNELKRLVRNLASNAGRHAQGVVRLTSSVDGGQAVLEVGDDGPGVPPGERALVFGRFSRSQSARDRSSGGTGLGLAIVAAIADRHDGSVDVTESRDGGALFTVRLPAAP
ncbi:MAG: ATP-binding protein, partial [Acidimicrobiales bacterium]